jgi:uncharacterized membrane protein
MLADLALARALHVLAVVHGIGGMAMVTWVIVPAVRDGATDDPVAVFERIEGRFSWQAKISTLLAGTSGFYLTDRLFAWERFAEPVFWWMHAKVAGLAIFTLVLFVAEPLFLHRWFHTRAARDPAGTMLVMRMHRMLLPASLVTVAGAVLGAHGGLSATRAVATTTRSRGGTSTTTIASALKPSWWWDHRVGAEIKLVVANREAQEPADDASRQRPRPHDQARCRGPLDGRAEQG